MPLPPGYVGYPVVGDKSVEFYRDPCGFVDRRISKYESQIFLTRLLNKPTICVGSNAGCRELLNDHSHCTELGYRSLMHQVFGDNILFAEGDKGLELRTVLHHLFSPDCVTDFQALIDSTTQKTLRTLDTGNPMPIYNFLKKLTTEICLSLFLDINFETCQELAENIVDLTTTHWHGIISIPTTLRLPMMQTSGFAKALEAKNQILEIIENKLSENCSGFPKQVSGAKFSSSTEAANHLLLFTSALVPKALASILTSFVLTLGRNVALQSAVREDPELHDCVLLEVQRMWPPFVGGRRLVRKDCSVEGYDVPAGHAVVYLTRHAQRDPHVFADPNSFQPLRWKGKNKYDEDKLFLYGSGPRGCLGKLLVDKILKTVTKGLLERFTWETPDDADHCQYKWLPVSRPEDAVPVTFLPLEEETPL